MAGIDKQAVPSSELLNLQPQTPLPGSCETHIIAAPQPPLESRALSGSATRAERVAQPAGWGIAPRGQVSVLWHYQDGTFQPRGSASPSVHLSLPAESPSWTHSARRPDSGGGYTLAKRCEIIRLAAAHLLRRVPGVLEVVAKVCGTDGLLRIRKQLPRLGEFRLEILHLRVR